MQSTKIAKICQLHFAKIGENCRVEMTKTRKPPQKVYLRCVSFFFYLLQFEKNAVLLPHEVKLLKLLSNFTQSTE
jgi:hypothetical protein